MKETQTAQQRYIAQERRRATFLLWVVLNAGMLGAYFYAIHPALIDARMAAATPLFGAGIGVIATLVTMRIRRGSV